jgi:hypothetical protein
LQAFCLFAVALRDNGNRAKKNLAAADPLINVLRVGATYLAHYDPFIFLLNRDAQKRINRVACF